MRLSNYQYDVLMQRFDKKRMNARYELDRRISEVYEKLPEIKEIDDSIASVSVSAGRSALMGDDSELLKLDDTIKKLSDEKRMLLTENGYAPDYLEEHFECPKCNDTGFIGNEPCECFKAAETELILEASNIKDIISKENFSTFNAELYSDDPEDYDRELQCTPYKNILSVYERAKSFTDNFDTEHKNLLIYGSTGLGKTFLTNCIANEILRSKHTVMYYTTFSLFDMLSKYIRSDSDYKEQSSYRDSVITCELLIIDDLGSEMSNTFTETQLYSIINERLLKGLSTVISSNLSPKNLHDRYGDRIFSRFMKDYDFIKLIGSDIRTKL
ncbi:MAG: ATP-binding protein [Lachnospiraceae bacterium]|nr:ATP-binding protein [Lachnospiraceae bacterium]